MLWQLAVVLLFMWGIISRWKQRKLIALGNQLRCDKIALPFIGHAYRFLGDDEDHMKTLHNIGNEAIRKGGLISHWQGTQLYIGIAEPVAADVAMKSCLEKDDIVQLFRELLGNGSIFAPVSIWRPRRKIIAPTFSPKNLNNFVEIFNRQSAILVNQLKTAAGKGVFSLWKFFPKYTMDSVCESTLGIQVNAQLQPDEPFQLAFEDMCKIVAKRMCQPWLYNERVYQLLCRDSYNFHQYNKSLIWNFMDKIITEKWAALKKNVTPLKEQVNQDSLRTFLELLVESSSSGGDQGYSKLELREEALVIVLAGTDTSAASTGFTTVLLARHPDIQEKVYRELQQVFGDSDKPVSPQDLPHLKYLDAVVRESLRLYPPVPFIVRRVDEDVTLPNGVTLVKGCGLFICLWSIHRNPAYWGADAEDFRPERFFDSPPKHPAAYMPFSYGPRSCLGYQYAMMSMKTALATLLRQYHVRPPSTEDYGKPLRVKFDIMLRDVNDYAVQLDLRT